MKRTKPTHLFTVLASAVFMVVVLVGVMFFAGFWTLKKTYNVSAYVPNARGIAQDSTVFEAGLPVGLVTAIQRHGPDAVLSLRLTAGVRPLPVDSKIQLGLRSVAGEADLLLYPGQSKQLVRNNGSLGLSQDESYTEVDQILNQLAGPTEYSTRHFFQGAGYAINGEGTNFNHVLGNFAAVVNNSPPLTSTLAAQHNQVADIVQNFGNIMGAIGQRSTALEDFARGARTTFDAVASRDVALDQALVQLPLALRGARSATNAVGNVSPVVVPVVNNLANTITNLTPALNALGPASSNGITLVQALGNASPALRNLLVNLTALKPSATQALPALHALTCQINPMLRYLAPYGRDLAGFFEDFGAADDPYGGPQDSHMLLTSAVIDPAHTERGILSNSASNLANEVIQLGIFGKLGAGTGYDAEPGPGNMEDTTKGLGLISPSTWQAAGYQYPHVTEDCPLPKGDAPQLP